MSAAVDRPEDGVARLLEAARQLLDRGRGPAGAWPRAAALLIRQALEESLDAYWKARGLALAECTTRAQLLCLAEYERQSAHGAADIAGTWHALSRACHHHAYELPPAAAELKGWLEGVERWHVRVLGVGGSGTIPPSARGAVQ